jgi:hypothetical protein
MDYSLDVGNNLTILGLLFLGLKYLLPILIGVILIAVGYFGGKALIEKVETFDVDMKTVAFVLALGFLALIALLS